MSFRRHPGGRARATRARPPRPGPRRFITTAGVSAGIDGSLHLVARLLGREVADRTARYMEYHWTPEAYLSEHYQLLNPSTDERGRSLQLAQIHSHEGRDVEAARICRDLIAKDANDGSAWYLLGEIAHQGGEYEEAAAAFGRATGKEVLKARALKPAAPSPAQASPQTRSRPCATRSSPALFRAPPWSRTRTSIRFTGGRSSRRSSPPSIERAEKNRPDFRRRGFPSAHAVRVRRAPVTTRVSD